MKRSAGRSAVAAAAYRAGETLRNESEGGHSDFSRRTGVLHTEILAPDGAAGWVFDREELWNRVEAAEKHPRAQLAREVELALPHELNDDERLSLLRQYVSDQFVSQGMIADIAVHEGHTDKRNIHAHVLLSMRELQSDGFGNKVREWNEVKNVLKWREAWATYQNEALTRAGHETRVDHRSYRDRDIPKNAQIHEGPKVRRMKARDYQPRSKTVRRRSWNNRPRKAVDYRLLDLGRTRRQRNHEIRWRNKVHASSGARMANAIEAHVHRWHFEHKATQAREAGKKLKQVGGEARRAAWLAERSKTLLALHKQQTQEIVVLANRLPNGSDALNAYAALRMVKLAQARKRAAERGRTARIARGRLKRAAIQYRNLKSQVGAARERQMHEQVAARHRAAFAGVTRHDIWGSALSKAQKQEMSAAWSRLRGRSRGADQSDR